MKQSSFLDKVRAIFADENKEEKMAEDTFVKTEDGKIISVKGGPLAVEAMVMWVNEDATESAIEDGDYTLEDGTVVSIKEGKVAEIATKEEEATEDEEMKSEVKMAVIKQVSKWAMDVDQDSIELGTILTQTYKNEDGTDGDPLPVCAGEYEMENGDTIQVDSEGKVVLITPKGEETVPAKQDAPVADETMSKLEARLSALEAKLTEKENELVKAKEDFNKLKSQPAAKPIDTRKVDMKAEGKAQATKSNSMLDAVRNITSK